MNLKKKNLLLIPILIAIDQISKTLFNFFSFLTTPIVNSGSLFNLLPNQNTTLIVFSILISIVLIFLLYKKKYSLQIAMILSGVLSNLSDRLIFSGVRDFIDLKFWPVFNLADSYIVIGSLLLIIAIIKEK